MAVTTLFTTIRTIKRIARRPEKSRMRRLVSGTEPAMAMATSVVEEIASRHPKEVELSRERGRLTKNLENALEEAKEFFLSRVESRHRELFSDAIDKIILTKKGEEK
jgi:hypothetical protein